MKQLQEAGVEITTLQRSADQPANEMTAQERRPLTAWLAVPGCKTIVVFGQDCLKTLCASTDLSKQFVVVQLDPLLAQPDPNSDEMRFLRQVLDNGTVQRVIVDSKAERQFYVETGMPKGRFLTIGPGIDLSKFEYNHRHMEERSFLFLPIGDPDRVRVVFIATHSRQTPAQAQLMRRAAKLFLKRSPLNCILWWGSGKSLANIANQRLLDFRNIRQDCLASLLCAADSCVLAAGGDRLMPEVFLGAAALGLRPILPGPATTELLPDVAITMEQGTASPQAFMDLWLQPGASLQLTSDQREAINIHIAAISYDQLFNDEEYDE
ncbi:MAG TPA: hypothetical protein VNG90_04760 [Candidatus Acidoferrum sp.]|nr:hypothetical protein [Candidatus Acidoferrum sp.]